MTHRPSIVVSAAIAAIAAVGVASCAAPDAKPPDEGPTTATTTDDGLTVQLILDRTTVGIGEDVGIIVAVQNLGRDAIRWRAGGCDLRASVTVVLTDIPDVGPRRSDVPDDDDADRQVLRFVAGVAGPGDTVASSRTIATTTPVAGRACQIDHGFAVLAPGQRLEERAAWSATTAAGAALGPGRFEVRGSFPMLGRDTPLSPADFRGERDVRPIVAAVELDVVGSGANIPVPGAQALRTLIERTALGAWVRSGAISAADAHLAYDRDGWTITVRLPTGGSAVGRVSADGRSVTDLGSVP